MYVDSAIAYNLKKLLKFTTRKVQTNVQVMQVNLPALFFEKHALPNQHTFY